MFLARGPRARETTPLDPQLSHQNNRPHVVTTPRFVRHHAPHTLQVSVGGEAVLPGEPDEGGNGLWGVLHV